MSWAGIGWSCFGPGTACWDNCETLGMFADQLISYRRIRIANGSLSNGKCQLNTKHCIDLQIAKLFFIVYVQEGYFFLVDTS